MAITNPNIIPRPIVSSTGSLTAASQIELTDATSVENALGLIRQSGFVWLYDSTTDADPTNNSFSFDNVTIGSITNIYLDKDGENARIDEYLTQFSSGSFVWVQSQKDPSFNILFTTNGVVSDTGGATGYFTIPVTYNRHVGTFNPTVGDRYTFHFLAITGAGGGGAGPTNEEIEDLVAGFITAGTGVTKQYDDPAGTLTLSLPNNFLAELSEVDTNTFTDRVDAPGDASFVRIWLRTGLVTPTNINDPGTGLLISEANGDLPNTGSTFSQTTNANNVYVYFTLPDSFVDPLDLNTLYLVRKDPDGNIVDTIQVGSNFVLQSDIDGAAAGRPYRSNSGLDGGSFLHYVNNQTLELFIVTVNQFFDIPQVNADNVDFTRGVKNLPESALAGSVQAKLNYNHGIPDDDQFKLDQLVEVSTTSASATLTGSDTIYYKRGAFSDTLSDYFTTDFDTGLPPSFDQSTTWLVAVPHNHTITSLVGVESGTGTATLFKDDVLITGATGTFNLYTCVVSSTSSGTNFYLFVGTRVTITEIDPTDLFKIDRDNVQPDFLTHIENTQGSTLDNQRLDALENKVSTLYPLATDVDALLDWGDIYVPERPVQEVVITQGYDLIADYRGPSTRYESAGVTYDDTGVNVVTYTGLSTSLQRIFGFKVTGVADQVLLWVIDGSDRIPFIDVTAAGTYRVNNYQQSRTAATPVSNEVIFLSLTSGGTNVMTLPQNAVFVVNDYPTGATDTSRSVQVGFDVLLNGSDTQAEHLQQIDVPETNIGQDRIDIVVHIPLGPLHSNRVVTVTIGYRFVFVDPEYRLILNLVDAPSDVTLRAQNVALTRSYTPTDTVVRTDDFQVLQDAGGNYTFTGENELIVGFQPSLSGTTMDAVPVAVNSVGTIDQLNDQVTSVPHAGFEDVEIPDTTALSGFEFRTARANHFLAHSDLASLIADRTLQWAYGLARLRTVATAHAVSEPVDLASGSTLNGVAIATTSGPLVPNVVYQATAVGTSAGELVSSIALPADYTNYDFVHITEVIVGVPNEWRHTSITTHLLNSGDIGVNDNVRIQGASDMTWTSGTRTLTIVGGSQDIYRVLLVDV